MVSGRGRRCCDVTICLVFILVGLSALAGIGYTIYIAATLWIYDNPFLVFPAIGICLVLGIISAVSLSLAYTSLGSEDDSRSKFLTGRRLLDR